METQKRKTYTSPEVKSRWNKANTTSIAIRFMHKSDKDILEKLAAVDSKAGYIKRLIREDIQREGNQ